MTDQTRARLLAAAEVAKLVLPLLPVSSVTTVVTALIQAGLTYEQARVRLAENNATAEQLAFLDRENSRNVFDVIREQGKAFPE